MSSELVIKRALALVIAGLVVTLFCVVRVTPGRFVAFAALGVPLVTIGAALFLWRGRGPRPPAEG